MKAPVLLLSLSSAKLLRNKNWFEDKLNNALMGNVCCQCDNATEHRRLYVYDCGWRCDCKQACATAPAAASGAWTGGEKLGGKEMDSDCGWQELGCVQKLGQQKFLGPTEFRTMEPEECAMW